jgi:predicted O-methyltransferase YrrM
MQYADFFARFGGSYRTKNIAPFQHSPLDPRAWFGAGPFSARKRLQNRRPYAIPSSSALPKEYIRLCPWEGEYLFMLASRARQGIVETGRFHGGSTFLLSCANAEVPIHSVDIAPKNDELVRRYMQQNGVGAKTELIVGDSQNVKYPQVGAYDLLWIDGDHSYEGCTKDLENWYPELARGGHVVLHDSYFGSPVQDSVIDFIKRHDVTLVQSPWIHARYWHHPAGGLAHFIKND